jgi:hypothetical protein
MFERSLLAGFSKRDALLSFDCLSCLVIGVQS